jgi:phosphate-selective porin OprO/OprP
MLILLAIVIFTAGDIGAQQSGTQGSNPSSASPQATPAEKSQEKSQETPPNKIENTSDASADDEPLKTIENTIDASEDELPSRRLVRWNEYEGPYFTMRLGAGLLVDFSAFAQDQTSKQQIAMHPDPKLRDFRLLLGGKLFPRIKRSITWSAGIMYDAPEHEWRMRQTGIMIAAPELWGSFFIGRSKEGFSLNKIMVGYHGWTMERSTMNDATIPILADGIKWLGYTPKHKFLWNVGYFNDFVSKGQAFSTYSSQVVGRFAVLPVLSEKENKVVHLGVNLRWGKPLDNKIRFKSRPESYPAPLFIDTGSFPSDSTRMAGYEAYSRTKRWLFGSEYWWVFVSSEAKRDPVFHGGEFVASYLFNDATRAYNTIGGYFRDVVPKRTVFEGGPGAWELVIRYSYSDFNNKDVQGGTFGRITSHVNWYLSDNVRLEANYGYGRLDRFNIKGNTQFFQTRLQLTF